MLKPRIYVDFHNADSKGRLRLNCVGTLDDLSREKLELQEGVELIVYSEELEAEAVVEYSTAERVWVAVIDWKKVRQLTEDAESHDDSTSGATQAK